MARILRDALVAERLGYKSRASVWRLVKADETFPRPVKISAGLTGWLASEVDEWLARRIAETRDAK